MTTDSDIDAYLDQNPEVRLLVRAGDFAEKYLECDSEIDFRIARECFMYAGHSLRGLRETKAPNEYKQAGHYTFWARKLKPFYNITSMAETDEANGERPGPLYFNEFTALLLGISVLGAHKHSVPTPYSILHEMTVSLRYRSFSPGALTVFFETLVYERPQIVTP